MLFQATPGPSQFGVLQSFFLLAMPVVGGIGSLVGAVVGGALLATAQPLVNEFHVRLLPGHRRGAGHGHAVAGTDGVAGMP